MIGHPVIAATAALITVSLLSGRPLITGWGLVLWVAVAVVFEILRREDQERRARRALARHRAKQAKEKKARTQPIPRHNSQRAP